MIILACVLTFSTEPMEYETKLSKSISHEEAVANFITTSVFTKGKYRSFGAKDDTETYWRKIIVKLSSKDHGEIEVPCERQIRRSDGRFEVVVTGETDIAKIALRAVVDDRTIKHTGTIWVESESPRATERKFKDACRRQASDLLKLIHTKRALSGRYR